MHPLVLGLAALFEGYSKAHGYYSKELVPDDNGKLKGRASTIIEEVTMQHWQNHVKGEVSLGIIPINEHSKVKFGVIDIDVYPVDVIKINEIIAKHKLPLVPCRTKSGGVHLYLFLTEFYDAGAVIKMLREFASLLGYGGSEIFPKQAKIIAERGDIGQWVNMPYFDAIDTKRYAYGPDNAPLSLETFLSFAQQRIVSPLDLVSMKISIDEILPGGPPCLNHLASMGFPDGTRNNGLFNLGVYARKAFPDGWEAKVEEYNNTLLDPPLGIVEVLGVIKSLQKKEFFYMCKQPPIAQYCNTSKCRGCKHGVGGGGIGLPKLGSLTKICTAPPLWFLDIEGGGRLELTTEDLQNQLGFQRRCMEVLNIMPGMMKRESWENLLQGLMAGVIIADVPAEATPAGQLINHLSDFCTSRVQGRIHDDLLTGKPWTNNSFHYFRLKDFLSYLERQKFIMKLNQITVHLRDLGAEKKFFNIKGRGVNVMMVKEFVNKQTQDFDIPPTQEQAPY